MNYEDFLYDKLGILLPKGLSIYYWQYVFENNTGLENIWCRMRGHPYGVVWFNCAGLEPDMSCKNCGEDLG